MKIIKKVVLVGFLLLQAACSEAGSLNALHVHFSGQNDQTFFYKIMDLCEDDYREGRISYEPKIIGDEALLGQPVVDKYWSRDGAYHARYQMEYETESPAKCIYEIVPTVTIVYENRITTKAIIYKRTYMESNAVAGGAQWDMLEAFKSGKLSAGKEFARAVQVPEKVRRLKAPGFLTDAITGTPEVMGEEVIAGKTCELRANSRWQDSGMKNYTCGWDPKGC